jgi:secretion/DNA translocation related TadE-like protein
VATVFVCLGVALVMAMTALAIHLGAAVLARQRAETAADLAALAGAARVLSGADLVCARATEVASANGVTVDSCVVRGIDVLISVVGQVDAGPLTGTVSARARAGPVRRITDGPG